MALTILRQPDTIVLSGNSVEFVISSNTVVNNFHKIHVRVIEIRKNPQQNIVIGEEVLPVLNSVIIFDISDYLKQKISLSLTVDNLFEKGLKSIAELTSRFDFEIFETYNGDGLEHNKLNVSGIIAIQGGFSTIYFKNLIAKGQSFSSEYIGGINRFMTWVPEKLITWNQHDFLFFVSNGGNAKSVFNLFFDDGSQLEIDHGISNLLPNNLYFYNSSIIANELLRYDSVGKRLVKYQTGIKSETGELLSEFKTYYVDRKSYQQDYQYVFRNSLGVYDIIKLTGIAESESSLERTLGNYQTIDSILFSEFTQDYETASGYLVNMFKNAKAAKEYAIELLNSKEVYEIVGNELIPIIPISKKLDKTRDDKLLHSFEFKYKYAFLDEFYSPLNKEQYFAPGWIPADLSFSLTISSALPLSLFTVVLNVRNNTNVSAVAVQQMFNVAGVGEEVITKDLKTRESVDFEAIFELPAIIEDFILLKLSGLYQEEILITVKTGNLLFDKNTIVMLDNNTQLISE